MKLEMGQYVDANSPENIASFFNLVFLHANFLIHFHYDYNTIRVIGVGVLWFFICYFLYPFPR